MLIPRSGRSICCILLEIDRTDPARSLTRASSRFLASLGMTNEGLRMTRGVFQQRLEFSNHRRRENLLCNLEFKNRVRSHFASGKRQLPNDAALRSTRDGKLGDLDVLKPRLLQVRPNGSERLSLKIRAEIGDRRRTERNQKIDRRALQAGSSRRRVLGHYLVQFNLRPVKRRNIADGQSALHGRDPGRPNAASNQVRNADLLGSQAQQDVDLLLGLDRKSVV